MITALLGLGLCPTAPAQWVQINELRGDSVYCFAVDGSNLFAGGRHGVFLSTNNGTSWTKVSNGLPRTGASALAVSPAGGGASGTNLFAGTSDSVYLSTNYGSSWTRASSGLTGPWITCLLATPAPGGTGRRLDSSSGTNIYAGIWHTGVCLSTNNGTNWTQVDGLANSWAQTLAVGPASGGGGVTNLFAGMGTGDVLLSTDSGTSWASVRQGLTGLSSVNAFAMIGTKLFVGANANNGKGCIFHSTDNGSNWTPADSGLTNIAAVTALAVSPTGGPYGACLFAGTYGDGIFLSTNGGSNWTEVNSGLTSTVVISLAVYTASGSGKYLFAGTVGGGVWRRPLSEMVTGVEGVGRLPNSFSLQQNYPNPFNPSTTIRYSLPRTSSVTLMVYNIVGQHVATLVEGTQEAGIHEVRFSAEAAGGVALANGVYYFRLRAGDFISTRTALLLR